MYWLYVVIALSMESSFVQAASIIEVNDPNYRSGPRIGPPFSNPGEIFSGITVEKVVQTFGDGWNADNLLQSANIVCDSFGSDINGILDQIGQEGIVDEICKTFESGEVERGCDGFWDLVTSEEKGSFSLIPGLVCRESDDYFVYTYNYTDYVYPYYNSTDYFYPQISTTNSTTYYQQFVDVEKGLLGMMGNFDLYNPCSETGISKINNIIFAAMDWLGPSVFTSIYRGQIEPYSICSILRYILSLDTVEYVEQSITFMTYPVADILESLRTIDICEISKFNFSGTLVIRVVKDLLVEYSDLNELNCCDFISQPQTREAYLELGETILRNVILTLADKEKCNNILNIVVPIDEQGIHVNITGFNLTIPQQRTTFCEQASNAFSPYYHYVPKPYKLPGGLIPHDFEPFKTPGEFLPGLTFIDLLEIEGATYRADKIIDGVAIYCIVFEDFISSTIGNDTFDVKGLCNSVKSQDTGSIEYVCLTSLVPVFYSHLRPELRPFDLLSVAIYTARELSGIADINKNEICEALDNFFNHFSLKDVVEKTIDIILTEATPSLNSVCENFEAAICQLKPYCPEPESPDSSSDKSVTFSPYIFHSYIPSSEEIASANAAFDEKFSIIESLLLIISGYEGRDELCRVVGGNIDPLSGRSDRTLVEGWRSNILGIFSDVKRCSEVVDTTMRLFSERDLESILTDDNTNLVYQLTGYQSSEEFCQAVADAFEAGLPVTTHANVELVGTYNIFAKIAIYIQRVSRSV